MVTLHFARLPPEIRFQIWEMALMAGWSITSFSRVKKRIKIAGETSHQNTARACHEARQIMRTILVPVEGLGWFHFNRTMFFFRDVDSSRSLMRHLADSYDLFSQIQHICINPCDQPLLIDTVRFVMEKCTSLRTLVLIGPWLIPVETDHYDPNVDWLVRNEHWSRAFVKSPTELDSNALDSLLGTVDYGTDKNEAGLVRYRSRLAQAIRRLPDQLLPLMDYYPWRINRTLNILNSIIEASVASPSLYLRSYEEIRGMSPDGSRFWSH